jgi:hypothetical protein
MQIRASKTRGGGKGAFAPIFGRFRSKTLEHVLSNDLLLLSRIWLTSININPNAIATLYINQIFLG